MAAESYPLDPAVPFSGSNTFCGVMQPDGHRIDREIPHRAGRLPVFQPAVG